MNWAGQIIMIGEMRPWLFRGVFDERLETIQAHKGQTHLYSFSNSIYKADVLISVPKLKTHHKTGVTLNLKGLVGTVSNKNYLVHWRNGFPAIGGDAYPDFVSWLIGRFQRTKKRGAWPGNDTIWRMVVDLYRGIQTGPKRFFSIIDGILAGEGEGPFCPEPKAAQIMIVGESLLETDIVATRLMGFDFNKVRYLQYLVEKEKIDVKKIKYISYPQKWSNIFEDKSPFLDFRPPSMWDELRIVERKDSGGR